MTILGEGSQDPSPEVILKTFLVTWARDGGISEYNHIVGSNLDNGLLFLMNDVNTEFLLNQDHIQQVIVSVESDEF